MKTSYVTPACCANPSIVNMDHSAGWREGSGPMVNRVCVRCWTHWYGDDGVAVFTFTRDAWDRWMNSPEEVAA